MKRKQGPCSKEALDDEKILDSLEEAASWTPEETLAYVHETLEEARANGDQRRVEVLEKIATSMKLVVEVESSGDKQDRAPDVAAAVRIPFSSVSFMAWFIIAAGNPFATVVLAAIEKWEEEHKPN